MPTFCRHNRLLQNCPICAREQHVELRPVVTPGGQSSSASRATDGSTRPRSGAAAAPGRPGTGRSGARTAHGLTVRRLSRGAEDGYRCGLVPGLKSSADAERLADELAFAATRLELLQADPPGLYAAVADPDAPVEERTWLAFLIAYLGPLDDGDPFAGIALARTTWSSGETPALDGVPTGPRTAHEASRGSRTIDAYRAWAQRAGSQAAAFSGEAGWTAERRFARGFERLALPGFDRGPRFDLLATLGRLGVYELSGGALGLGGNDGVTLAAKRVLGIGDPMLLERRAADLAAACALPLEALDVGLYNWERGTRAPLGIDPGIEADAETLAAVQAGLGL
ncbi:MAG: hypothetical protein ABSH51_00780 [Solirubrobacteraceae bacterium]|jgi:hypothetical protein